MSIILTNVWNETMKELSMKEWSELMSLDRHFVWADHFKRKHYELLESGLKIETLTDIGEFFANPVGMYMCYWYATLYTVIEGLDSYKFDYSEIKSDVNDIKDSLRLFRNVIYHHQPGYFDERLFEIMKDKDSRTKIKAVHLFLDTKLREEMKNCKLKSEKVDMWVLFKRK